MSMIKKVGSKLDSKLKSGELKESEIMQEAMDLMEKMEKMPGMANMKNMLNQMGMPGMGKNGKVNMGAMKGKLNQNMRGAKQRERMLRKLEKRKAAKKDDQINLLQQQLAAAKRANHDLEFGAMSVASGLGSAARATERGLESAASEVGSVARDTNSELKNIARGTEQGIESVASEVGSFAKGAEDEMEHLTDMFNKQKIGGRRRARSKRRRNKRVKR